jgi:hypothetical protein
MPTKEQHCFRRVGIIQFDGKTALGWPKCPDNKEGMNKVNDCCTLLDEQFLAGGIPQSLYEDVSEDFKYTIILV